jgi:uroporphyrinogen decarboxylase
LLQVFESWGGELSPQEFQTFSLPYLRQIATRVKSELKSLDAEVPMFVFARGSHYALELLDETPYDVISLDWTIDPKNARERVKSKTLQGNADPSLLYGTKETIRANVKTMIKSFGKKKYIANLGHGMYPGDSILIQTMIPNT